MYKHKHTWNTPKNRRTLNENQPAGISRTQQHNIYTIFTFIIQRNRRRDDNECVTLRFTVSILDGGYAIRRVKLAMGGLVRALGSKWSGDGELFDHSEKRRRIKE